MRHARTLRRDAAAAGHRLAAAYRSAAGTPQEIRRLRRSPHGLGVGLPARANLD